MGKRNPNWQRQELILALDLYFKLKQNDANKKEQYFLLSCILNSLNIHDKDIISHNFRSPTSVEMKLGNLARLDPEAKKNILPSGGNLEIEIWYEYSNNLIKLRNDANQIIANIESTNTTNLKNIFLEDLNLTTFEEGSLVSREHLLRERNSTVAYLKKKLAIDQDNLKCEVCNFDFLEKYGELGKNFIECHHIVPLSEYQFNQDTLLKDLALLCSNCHRMVHRRSPAINLDDLRKIIQQNR